jgi:hypothetical protein
MAFRYLFLHPTMELNSAAQRPLSDHRCSALRGSAHVSVQGSSTQGASCTMTIVHRSGSASIPSRGSALSADLAAGLSICCSVSLERTRRERFFAKLDAPSAVR